MRFYIIIIDNILIFDIGLIQLIFHTSVLIHLIHTCNITIIVYSHIFNVSLGNLAIQLASFPSSCTAQKLRYYGYAVILLISLLLYYMH